MSALSAPVPGFAQTNIDSTRDPLRSSQNVARVYVAAASATFDAVEHTPNLMVAPIYQPLIAVMLARSPTFRRQCMRIAAAPDLSVHITTNPPVGSRSAALTRIHRRPGGRVEAIVQVGISDRLAELIAHELEHVIEQLDGIDLSVKARLRASGVRRLSEIEAYETRRAIVTGQRVAREVSARTP